MFVNSLVGHVSVKLNRVVCYSIQLCMKDMQLKRLHILKKLHSYGILFKDFEIL